MTIHQFCYSVGHCPLVFPSSSAREGLHLLTFAKSKSYRVHIFQYSYSTVKFAAVIISLVTIVRYISSFISSVPHLLFWSNDLFNKSVQWLKWVLTKILKYFWGNKLWVAKGTIMKTSFGHNFYVFWKYLTLSLRQKINFLRFWFFLFYHKSIAFHGVFAISYCVSKFKGKLWYPNYFNSAHKKNVDTFLLCLKGVFSGNWESWNFLDTFNHSKNIFKRKNIFLTVRTFFWLFFRKFLLA